MINSDVSLIQMLEARDWRVYKQKQLIAQYKKPVMCFTMNIAGPIKNNELIRRAFEAGMEDFRLQVIRFKSKILYFEEKNAITGNEAFFVVDMNALQLKKLTCELEDYDELGRLYDMDVIYPDENGNCKKIDRQEINLPGRKCLLCDKPAKECSSRRSHTVKELQEKTTVIIKKSLKERDGNEIASLAIRSLLYEVCTTPKPGLVDTANRGSHKDMDLFTFANSAASLYPYFKQCYDCGYESKNKEAKETFKAIKAHAKMAENRMLKATDGVNTHKGAIFTLGILCAATGRLEKSEWKDWEKLLFIASSMVRGIVAEDFACLTKENAKTAGQRLYLEYGITGVRGQMEAGLPAVKNYGLPILEKLLSEGKSNDYAGAITLLHLIANTTDTNMISRSNVETQKEYSVMAAELVKNGKEPSLEELEDLDRKYIEKNLSPGGSADLLAVCWLLHFMKEN